MTRASLPIGLQIMDGAFDEATMLRMADAYEAATGWQMKNPNLAR